MTEDCAPNTGASTKSAARLKISPDKLPKVPYSRPHVIRMEDLPKECRLQVRDYFRKVKEKRKAAYFAKKWGNK